MNEVRAGALRHYGFECDCPACDPSNLGFGPNFYDESRERRFTLEDIEEQIPPDGRFWPAEDGHLNERLKLALQTAAILRQEWAYTGKLGRIYHDIALLAWNQGEGGLAETAARSAIYVYATSCGLDHQYTRFERGRFRDMIQKIKLENAKKDGEATHNGGEVVEYAETDAAVEQVTKLGI
ncbi:hypothetical protein P152DRAFT_455899 [Eremomyces bilateralis CBS 781.70]|uniref:Uncharacterized protein n=1 Tax=Eremomyces bilateralis CBS 781.70 TaxID=1392243 RepID=A0A6G1GAC0_9PEZI|nr:uncharacterized protein P152DRAFT_455899 [Eremomyces bilateralis CBS 781.70]KAF1814860.1 hypothetical protein P152DRAFT_455899 [Eremomyces bilateralis CBS 781.70]